MTFTDIKFCFGIVVVLFLAASYPKILIEIQYKPMC